MKSLFWIMIIVALSLLLCTVRAEGENENDSEPAQAEEEEKAELSPEEQAAKREKDLARWRVVVQEILTSITAGPLGKDFTPDYIKKRKAPIAIKNQLARVRGKLASAMIETIGSRAEVCFERRYCNDVLDMLKHEMGEHGFKVDWTPDAKRDVDDPRRCYAGRESMVVRVPPADPGLPE